MRKKLSEMRGRGGKLLLFFILIAVMFCLTGCMENQVNIETTVNVDSKGSGTRQMTLSLDENKLTGGFDFSTEELEETLKSACPETLKWTKESDKKHHVYVFTLNFSSLEDYQKKVKKITGKDAEIYLKAASGTFASGIRYKENFTSEELFAWLTDALVENGYIESGTKLYNEAAAVVQYGDNTYTASGAKADINSVRDAWADGVDIFTTYHANGKCDRRVLVWFDSETYADNEQILEKRMEKRCPDGAEISWERKNESWCCTVSEEGLSAKKLNSFMKSLFPDSDSMVHAEGAKWNSALSKTTDWNETLDVLKFTKGSDAKLSVGYYVSWDDGVTLSVKEKNEEEEIEPEKSEKYTDYYTVYEGNTDKCSFTTTFAATFEISKIDVKDKLQKGEYIARTIDLVFSGNPTEKDISGICDILSERADSQATITSGDGQIEVYIRANSKGQNKIFGKIFGADAQGKHEINKKLMEFSHKGTFSQTLDFTGFLENDPENTEITYQVKFRISERVVEKSVNSELNSSSVTMEMKKHQVTVSTTGGYMNLTLNTKTFNASGLTLLGILLCIVLIVIALRLLAGYAQQFWGFVKKGTGEFNHAFDGRDEDDREILEKRYKEEEEKKSHFPFVKNAGHGWAKKDTQADQEADASTKSGKKSASDGYSSGDDVLYYGINAASDKADVKENDTKEWDPGQLVETVTETVIRTEDASENGDDRE